MEDAAKSLLVEMLGLGLHPGEQTTNNLINMLRSKGKVEAALDALETMVLRGDFCITSTSNLMLDLYFTIGKPDKALSLFTKMKSHGVNEAGGPNQATYSTIIHGLCTQGRLYMAKKILWEMIIGRTVIGPDASIYCSIEALCKQERVEDADQLMKSFYCLPTIIKPNVSVFGCLIDGLLKHGQLSKARFHLEHMISTWSYPKVEALSVSFLLALSDEGYVGKAKELFLEIYNGGTMGIPLCAFLIDALYASGDEEEAKAFLKSTAESSGWLGVLDRGVMFNNLCKKGSFDSAEKMLGLIMELDEFHGSLECSSLINGLCSQGRFCEVLDVLSLVEVRGYEIDAVTCNTLMDEYCKEGMFEDAYGMLLEMEGKGFSPNIGTLNALISGFARQKEGARVEELLQKMRAIRISPDLNTKCILSECLDINKSCSSA